jgi:hypothetical protein
MQCNFCHKEITEAGYVWLNKQWCVISHVEPHAGAGLPGLKQPAHGSREEREDFKFERKLGLDNIKRDLLYNYNLRFTGTKNGGWCVRQC